MSEDARPMQLAVWREAAIADAERRGFGDARSAIEANFRALESLRTVDWNDRAATNRASARHARD